MGMIDAKTAQKITELLSPIAAPVRLSVFTRDDGCMYCQQTGELAGELAALSDHLSVETFDFDRDAEAVARFGIERTPAIVVHGAEDRGIRFYGIPAGYEFTTLLEAVVDFGTGRPSQLSPATLQSLEGITRPVRIQVFFTPQ